MIARVRAPRTRVHAAYMHMQWLRALCLSIRGMYVGAAASLHSFFVRVVPTLRLRSRVFTEWALDRI